ncbi:unnamed protein product [Agarophyton chilense]|eukprot:gb/GEZJ01001712.1/.p1 GENE.gb/GEZJ01001712.1/~~gb/GEZJ01001712.1/.p1  ORF type:complete len:598 (+),score=78.19 gb/GEZJ01001712.1/:4186-5979(+)
MPIRRTNDILTRGRRRAANRSKQPNTQWFSIDDHGRPQSGCALSSDDDSSSDWDSSEPLSVFPPSRKRSIRVSRQRTPPALAAPSLPPVGQKATHIHQWVASFIELRRLFRYPKSIRLTSVAREWLSEQHRALENAALPVMFKCILAVCNASQAFRRCRNDFLRPEYRHRYWSWGVTFVDLVDYHLDYGHVKVHVRGGERYKSLMLFIQDAQAQRYEGTLSVIKEQLLSALGVQWERSKADARREGDWAEVESNNELNFGGNKNESDLEPYTYGMTRKMKGSSLSQRTKKRGRFESAQGTNQSTKTKPHSSVFDSGYSAGMAGFKDGRRPILDWAKHIVELRKYFKRGKGYEIPAGRMNLTIWMNAEMARSIAGTLPAICCCVLKVTKVTDMVDDTVYISEECESWCKCYVEYLDYALETAKSNHRVRKVSTTVTDFMFDCRQNVIEHTLSEERAALLRAVDEKWLESKLMDLSIRRNRAKPDTNQLHNIEETNSIGSVEEEELDSGTQYDEVHYQPLSRQETRIPKLEKLEHTGKECETMVSEMIKGVIGETVEGRKRTLAERRAQEWVSASGTQALNKFARVWFRDATMNIKTQR